MVSVQKARSILVKERDGSHGQSERRLLGEFLVDALDETDPEEHENPVGLVISSIDVIIETAEALKDQLSRG